MRVVRSGFPFIVCFVLAMLVPLRGVFGAEKVHWRGGPLGIKAGIFSSGQFELTPKAEGAAVTLDTRTSYSWGIFFDFPVATRLSVGISVDLSDIKFSDGASEQLVEFGGHFKSPIWAPTGRLAFRPGLGVGYGLLREVGRLDFSRHMTLRLFGEVVAFSERGQAILAEAGLWWAVSGWDATYDITAGPMPFVRGGVIF